MIEFTYGTAGLWPAIADGDGPSLEFRNAEADPTLGPSWSASVSAPTPGLGPAPRVPPDLRFALDDADVLVSFHADPDTTYTLQGSDDLVSGWEVIQQLPAAAEVGFIEIRVAIDPDKSRRFFRLVSEERN